MVCSHCGLETLLTCIRCQRPYCQDCLQRFDAGLICFECMGQPPPATQRRRRAISEVLALTGIAGVADGIFLLASDFNLGSPLALIAGVAAGWLIGDRVRRTAGGDVGRARWLGASALLQGVLAASLLVALAQSLQILPSPTAALSVEFPLLFLALVLQSAFFLAAGVAAVFWRQTRY